MGYIEEVHKKNFEIIQKYNIKVGTVFKNCFALETVTHIHSLYGWIKTDQGDAQRVPQEAEQIFLKHWEIL